MSLHKKATIVIFLVLQSTPTYVNKVTGYSIIAPYESQKPNLITVLLYIERNKKSHAFASMTDGKQDKASELDMITLRNHAPLSYRHDYP